MPALIAWLARVFSTRLGSWIAGAFVFLGLSLGTQEFAIAPLRAYIETAWAGVGADIAAWLGAFNIDRAITILLSAIAARATIAGGALYLKRRAAPGGT